MDSELRLLIDNNSDLSKYLNKYSDNSLFLYHYYLQDIHRIGINYYKYCERIDVPLRVKLGTYLVDYDIDKRIASIVLVNLANYQFYDQYNEMITTLFRHIIDLIKAGKINKNDYASITSRLIDLDPLYFLNIDYNDVSYVYFNDDEDLLIQVLKLGKEKNYFFTYKDEYFVNHILKKKDVLVYFINNCNRNDYIDGMITDYFDESDNSLLYELYGLINDEELKKFIVDTLNFDNPYVDTIIDHQKYYISVSSKEESLNHLRKIKEEGLDLDITLIMNRVDLDFIDKACEIYGDKLLISPLESQASMNTNTDVWNYPCYTVKEIRHREKILDLYAKTVEDKVDKDGDIKHLSPFEKFIAAYILVTKFAPYREETYGEDASISRSVYEFIDRTNNKTIVCVGYVHLLREILYRMGMEDTINWSVQIGSGKDGDNHERMLIHLVDPKYGINGIYMVDPTWDESARWSKYEGSYVFRTKNMLMSKSDLEAYNSEEKLKKLHVDKIGSVGKTFKVRNPKALFDKPINGDMIVKGFLSVEHFLDKNMKMTDTYTDEEYKEMCDRLGFEAYVAYPEPTFDDLVRMDRQELEENFYEYYENEDMRRNYLKCLKDTIKQLFKDNDIRLPFNINHRSISIKFNKTDPIIDTLKNCGYRLKYTDNNVIAEVYEYDDRSMYDQFSSLLIKTKVFNDLVDNYYREKPKGSLK